MESAETVEEIKEYIRPNSISNDGITLLQESHTYARYCEQENTACFGHYDFKSFPLYEEIKLDLFESGRSTLLENLTEQASNLMKHKKYAEALTLSRMANELPDKLSLTFSLSNFGLTSDNNPIKNLEEISLGFINANSRTKMIEEKSRELITGNEIDAWSKAIEYFANDSQTQAAGISAFELGQEYEKFGQTNKAKIAYRKASEFLRLRLSQVKKEDDVYGHLAETKELEINLVNSQAAFLRVYSNEYPLKGLTKELVKQAVYELDDLDAPRDIVINGYRTLAKSSGIIEGHFYRKEAAGIAGQLIREHHFYMIKFGEMETAEGSNRPNRRHLRSQVLLELSSYHQR